MARLRKEQTLRPRKTASTTSQKEEEEKKRKLTEEEVQEIFLRLQKCDFTKGPPDSRTSRFELPYFRYSYIPDEKIPGLYEAPKVPKEKLDEILQRLCTFDPQKYPPDSKPHLKK